MKAILTICALVAAGIASASDKPATAAPAAGTIRGEVLEVLDAKSFTYLRLKTAQGEVWASVPQATVKTGAQVAVENAIPMRDFRSTSLNRTFAVVYLGNLAGAPPAAPHAAGMENPHGGGVSPPVANPDAPVAKARGANALTVAEVVTGAQALKGKTVLVRGRIVKYHGGIMGRNWIHLHDGSGSAADGTNDILVTTTNPAQAGEIVTVQGIVRTDRDFGAGYAYKVLIEKATLQRK